jgi:hypothetical protein
MSIYVKIFVMYLFTRGFSLRRDIGYSLTGFLPEQILNPSCQKARDYSVSQFTASSAPWIPNI